MRQGPAPQELVGIVGASGFLPWVILGGGVVQAANSGSPLLDRSGSVVGIVAGKLNAIQVAETTGETTENVTLAVSLGTIRSFLDSHAVPYVSNDSTQSKNYADIATEAMRYTVLLECAR